MLAGLSWCAKRSFFIFRMMFDLIRVDLFPVKEGRSPLVVL